MFSFSSDGIKIFTYEDYVLAHAIKREAENLIKEFKLSKATCKFITPTFLDYMKILYNYRDKDNGVENISIDDYLNIVASQDYDRYHGSFIHCRFFPYKGKMMYIIALPLENLSNLCVRILNNADNHTEKTSKVDLSTLILTYCKMCIRHELGHIISHKNVIKSKGLNQGFNYILEQNKKDMQDYGKFINKCLNNYSYKSAIDYYMDQLNYYYSLPSESIANKEGHINEELFKKLTLTLNYGTLPITNDLMKEINTND